MARQDADAAALSTLGRIAIARITSSPETLSFDGMKQRFRETLTRDPLDTLLVTVLGGSYLFYLAEVGKNPKVTSFWDALTFITTCLSVGYDDVFARTDAGKAIASVVMTFGPAISSSALDPPASEPDSLSVQRAILAELVALRKALQAPSDQAPS